MKVLFAVCSLLVLASAVQATWTNEFDGDVVDLQNDEAAAETLDDDSYDDKDYERCYALCVSRLALHKRTKDKAHEECSQKCEKYKTMPPNSYNKEEDQPDLPRRRKRTNAFIGGQLGSSGSRGRSRSPRRGRSRSRSRSKSRSRSRSNSKGSSDADIMASEAVIEASSDESFDEADYDRCRDLCISRLALSKKTGGSADQTCRQKCEKYKGMPAGSYNKRQDQPRIPGTPTIGGHRSGRGRSRSRSGSRSRSRSRGSSDADIMASEAVVEASNDESYDQADYDRCRDLCISRLALSKTTGGSADQTCRQKCEKYKDMPAGSFNKRQDRPRIPGKPTIAGHRSGRPRSRSRSGSRSRSRSRGSSNDDIMASD